MQKNMRNFFNKKNKKNEGWIEGFDRTESIFIHIPKAAGTSIAVSLYGEDPWHYEIKFYRDNYKKKFLKYKKFAFIRNPYDRLFSSYRYSFIQFARNSSTNVAFVTKYKSFENFVIDWVTRDNVKNHYFFKPQVDYLCDECGRLIIDFLGRYETLHDDYLIVSNMLNSNEILGQSNSSGEKLNYRKFYDKKMIDIVKNAYFDDFKMFNYEFST